MSAPASIYHRGVLKVAGVVHVGPPERQVGNYLRDATSYADGGLRHIEHAERELREQLMGYDECARRSLVCATVAMLTWGLS